MKLIGVDYARLSGTSMATPHVSGVAALVWSARPTLTAAQVRGLLQDSAKDLGTPQRDNIYGFGLVQAKAALDLLQTRYP
jgi:subtilisin family serine protease